MALTAIGKDFGGGPTLGFQLNPEPSPARPHLEEAGALSRSPANGQRTANPKATLTYIVKSNIIWRCGRGKKQN